jgi:hypothetical protein
VPVPRRVHTVTRLGTGKLRVTGNLLKFWPATRTLLKFWPATRTGPVQSESEYRRAGPPMRARSAGSRRASAQPTAQAGRAFKLAGPGRPEARAARVASNRGKIMMTDDSTD